MNFIAERLGHTADYPIRLEHYHRYAAITQHLPGKDVLDVACGEGYGASFMAALARSVVGIDISGEAVQRASSIYRKSNLEFRHGNATALDFANSSFDAVVLIRNLEYSAEQRQVLAEVRRVLRPAGLLFIASPDHPMSVSENGEPSRAGIKEPAFDEFAQLLKTYFPAIHYLSQRMLVGSVIHSLNGQATAFRTSRGHGSDIRPTPGHLEDPVYLLAVCGASHADLPCLDASVLFPNNRDLLKQYFGFARVARSLENAAADRDNQVDELDRALAERDRQIAALRDTVQQSAAQVGELLSSTSWRVTAPLRALRPIYLRIAHLIRSPLPTDEKVAVTRANIDAKPNPGFDLSDYPHIAAADTNSRHHYFTYGVHHKRPGAQPIVHGDLNHLNSTKATVLVVSHEASRTGAPILALNIAQHLRDKYNVIALLLGTGELVADFHSVCDAAVGPVAQPDDPAAICQIVTRICTTARPKFAIVNSIRSRVVLPSLAQFFVPTLSLIHEFASYTVPVQGFSEAAFWASEMVFSAAIVRESAREECPGLRELHAVVLPQGRSLVPQPDCSQLEYEREVRRARRALRPSSLPSNAVVVLGAGSVNFRKGVDLFLSCAARVAARHPSNPFYFVWIGYGFDPIKDLDYSIYLRDQLQRAGLTGLAAFAGEFAHIDLAYELADVLFLSSRLDALPNVVIDAAHYQLPVVCFDRTTGIADMLKDNGLGDACVAPYLDIEQAAQRLVDFIDKPELRMRIGSELNTLGSRLFDMERYVASLERLALQCAAQQEIERQDCALIEDAGVLRVDFASPPMAQVTRQDATRTFVRSCASGIGMRKPFPGFHPGIYRDAHSASTEHRNPLVDFLQAGKPTGPWLCDVISPSSPYDIPKRQLRVALHIHAFYADLVPDIRSRLDDQDLDLDLLISVPSQAIADRVRLLLSRRSGRRQEIRVVPNRGRDIGPLLTEFGAEIVAKYDLIGHIHTKKTADIEDVRVGRQWFDFLLENLLGGSHPMAAKIIAILAADDGLGLVFPDDPNTVGWTDNRSIASDLAERLGIEELPGGHFWFPVGTMFWAKTKALRPLLDLRFEWEDYPEEPLPYDGTVLHAIERLLPTVAKKAGYRIALTNIPGVTR